MCPSFLNDHVLYGSLKTYLTDVFNLALFKNSLGKYNIMSIIKYLQITLFK